MTLYKVTITVAVEGEERHAERVADKLETIALSSKRVFAYDGDPLVSTDIEEVM